MPPYDEVVIVEEPHGEFRIQVGGRIIGRVYPIFGSKTAEQTAVLMAEAVGQKVVRSQS